MVVSFHRIFLGEFSPRFFLGIFFVSPIWIHQGFLSQLHGSLVSNLQLGANNGGFGLGNVCVFFFSMNIGDTHRDIVILYEFVYGSTCILWYNYIHDIYYLDTILDGHHSWIMMRGTTSMHLQWRLLSDQQEDDHTCAHGEKFHAWLRMLKPSGIWQAITWLPGQIQFETSLQFHGFFPHSRDKFWISQVYVDESSSYLYIISEGEVV